MAFACLTVCLILFGRAAEIVTELQQDEWVDPTDMLHYDASSKTMRRGPEGSKEKTGDTKSNPIKREDIWNSPENCQKKLSALQKGIQDIKEKAADLMEQDSFPLIPENKLAQLLTSIDQLSDSETLQEDSFCNIPKEWFRRCVLIWFHMVATNIAELLYFLLHDSSHVTPCLISIIILPMFIFVLVKWFNKVRRPPEQAEENNGIEDGNPDNLHNVDGQQGNQEEDELNPGLNIAAEVVCPRGAWEGGQPAPQQVCTHRSLSIWQKGNFLVSHPTCAEQSLNQRRIKVKKLFCIGMVLFLFQVPPDTTDNCCDENYEITKLPTTETNPTKKYSS